MRREVSSEHLRAAHLAVAGSLLAWLALCAFARATTMIDPYDGAHHTVLARNLAFGGRYGLWDYGRWVVWPLDVSVGPTLIPARRPPRAGRTWRSRGRPRLPDHVGLLRP